MVETAILGAGAVGLTLAVRLALAGHRVTVVERGAHPGGLAAGFSVGDTTLEKFYHHLFTTDTAILDLIKSVGLGDEMRWSSPNTSLLIGGQPHRLDSPRAAIQFSPLPIWDRLRMGAAIAYLRYSPNYRPLEARLADPWLRRWMGRRAYEVVWKPQLVGKFGDYAAQISLAWMWARTHDRSTSLGYLHGGFQRLYDRLAAIIAELEGTLCFETSVTAIRTEAHGRLRVETTGGPVFADRVISTLPTRLTLDMMPLLPTYYRRYAPGEALGAHCVILSLEERLSDEVYWLAICDPGYPFLVVVEHTHFIPSAEYGGRHLVYLGNYLPMTHPLFRQSKDEVLATFLPALARLYPTFRPEQVRESWLFAAPYAQPIVTPEFHNHIPPHTTPIRGLYLANMFQVYPHDRGQNYAVAMAEALAQQLINQAEP